MGLDACMLSREGELARRRLIESAHKDVLLEVGRSLGLAEPVSLPENLSNRIYF